MNTPRTLREVTHGWARAMALALPVFVVACSEPEGATRPTNEADRASGRDTTERDRQRRSDALARMETELQRAQRRDDEAITTALAGMQALIESRKDSAPSFARAILSLSSKLEFLISSKRAYRRYVGRKFDRFVLSREELEREIELAMGGFEQELAATDGRLLVALGADLPVEFASSMPSRIEVPDAPGVHTRRVLGRVEDSVHREIGVEVTTAVATRVVGSVAARAGSGTLARVAVAGAGLSFGATLGIALLVDVIFSWFDDTEEKIAADTRDGLDELSRQVIQGSDQQAGLEEILRARAKDRQALRRAALMEAIGVES